MLKRIGDFVQWSAPLRKALGNVRGMRAALSLRRATWAAPKNTLVAVRVPNIPYPIQLRAGTSDAAVFFQVFVERQAHFPVDGCPTLIVDAGANIGLTAIVFAVRFPEAKVLALEIDESNFSLLQQNTRHYPNILPMRKGLWSHRTRIQVANPEAESWSFRASEEMSPGSASIDAVAIDDILAENGSSSIDVLKIDIEGGEFEVFSRGASRWIDRVGTIAVEVHDHLKPGCSDAVRRAAEGHRFIESQWAEYLVLRRAPECADRKDFA